MAHTITCPDRQGNMHTIDHDTVVFRISAYGILVEDRCAVMVKSKWVDKWEFPGGGVHPTESIPEGLIREFKEETGIHVDVGELFHVDEGYLYANDRGETWHSVILCYRVKRVGGTLNTEGNGDDIFCAKTIPLSELHESMVNTLHIGTYKKLIASL